MMLLAGFIFVIGLLAMSAMLSRIPILAKQVSREVDRPLLEHISPMVEGLDTAILELDGAGGLTPGTLAYDDAVRGLLAHLQLNSAQHGLVVEWRLACDVGNDETTARAHLEVTDGELWVKVRTTRFTASTCTF